MPTLLTLQVGQGGEDVLDSVCVAAAIKREVIASFAAVVLKPEVPLLLGRAGLKGVDEQGRRPLGSFRRYRAVLVDDESGVRRAFPPYRAGM